MYPDCIIFRKITNLINELDRGRNSLVAKM